jgi:molybdopterin adenylyltransferase
MGAKPTNTNPATPLEAAGTRKYSSDDRGPANTRPAKRDSASAASAGPGGRHAVEKALAQPRQISLGRMTVQRRAYNPPVSHEQHRATSPTTVRCAVITVSDTRTEATDTGGRAIVELLRESGHTIVARAIVRDEPDRVRALLEHHLADDAVQVVVSTGGTGITSRDGTFEVVTSILEKTLTGFGELFRMLSYEEIGSAAMMSRAVAGVAHRKVVIALPGSEHAVRLAMTKLVLPELGHLVREVSR